MNTSTWVKVARYHLVDRFTLTALPCAVLAFDFLITIAISNAVLLAVAFVYGMWFGLVYRRWNLIGLLAFAAAQIIVLLAGGYATIRRVTV